MQLRGTLYGLLKDIEGNTLITLKVGKEMPDMSLLEGKDLDIKIVQHREKRTMTQNAYYWVLLAKLAAKLRISTARLHNMKLREVAPPFVIDGKIAMQPIPDTDKAANELLEATTYHLKPTSGIIVGNDDAIYRWYVVLRGSSTFDTQEMTVLLDSLIEDCKSYGIETMTPDELEKMRQWEKEREKKANAVN